MKDETYNGWSNYPTWAVNLWLTNDEGIYNATLETIRENHEPHVHAADALQAYVEDMLPDLGASFPADLLTWANAQVDWPEIAAEFVLEVATA